MKKYNIILLLLVLELSCFQGHAILKREANEVDTYKVKEDTDTLEIINPKAKKPTLREIIYYHVIEKPYPGKHISEENDFKAQFKDVTRPFTNGHGFQYLNENKHDEEESNEVKEPTNHETEPKLQIHDEKEPETPVRDETDLDDLKTADEMHHDEISDGNKDEVPKEIIPSDEIINVKEDKPRHDKIEAMRRRKREIDYTIMPAAPPLPAFRMDILPDYIKAILPTDNDPTQTLKSKSIERPITITNIPETSTEKSRNSDAEIPRISIRIDDDEKTDHKIIKKSTRNVDDEIEKEIREVIRKVSDAANGHADSPDPRSYGMDLIGNSGIVWNDLNNQHLQYNVGPDANNEEVHNEQIPIKPQEVTDNEDKDLVNEIANTLNEIEHIIEEVVLNNNDLNEGTTESNDIEIIINKNQNKHKEKPQIKTQKKNYKVEEESQTKREFTTKIDPRSLINDNINEIEPKSIINPDNAIDIETALNFLEVLQDIVANVNNNEPRNDSNKEDSKVKTKDVTDEPERDRKHNHHKEKEAKDTSNKNEIDDLLNNDKYWQWLKDSSQATLNLLMKRVNGLIKEEVAQQIQELVTKMMEEQGYQHPETKEPEKQEDDETKPTDENDETKISGDDKEKNDITIEESDDNPQVLDKLMKNDKWKWLTNSSEAYLGALMKRINNLIKEEVTRQVEHLMKYHMPKSDQSESTDNDNKKPTEDINTQKDESKDNINGDSKKDLKNSKEKIKTSKTAKDDLKTEPNKTKNEVKSKSHKNAQDEDKKHTDRKKKSLIDIQAENSYGSSVGNEKVTNIFIFNLNGPDLKNLKPISSGNGMFIFGTEKNNNSAENNNNNKEINEQPATNEINETDSSKMNSTTDSNKDKTFEEVKPINEVEKTNLDSQENSNKAESTTTSSSTEKDIDISESGSSSKNKHNDKEKDSDSSQKDTEKISEDHKNKDKGPSEENPVNNEKADSEVKSESNKTENKSAEVTKTESNDETKHNSNTEEKTSQSKELKDEKDSKKSNENEEVKPESTDKTD